jgi:hypothetical protein
MSGLAAPLRTCDVRGMSSGAVPAAGVHAAQAGLRQSSLAGMAAARAATATTSSRCMRSTALGASAPATPFRGQCRECRNGER